MRLVAVLLLSLLGASQAQAQDFRANDLDGVEHRLSDLRGKWVVLNYWATWCPPCLREMPELQAFHARHADADAVVWGITFEDTPAGEIRAFARRLGVTYPILGRRQDPNTPFGQVRALPTTFLIDPEGLFVRSFIGPVTAEQLEDAIRR